MDSIRDISTSTTRGGIVTRFIGDTAVEYSLLTDPTSLVERLQTLSFMANAIRESSIRGIRDVVVSPDRVTVLYNPLLIDCLRTFEARVHAALAQPQSQPTSGRLHDVPVRYGGESGPDFDAVCRAHAIDTKTLIQLHTEPEYVVTAIGFVPGFPYLEGLPKTLETPRLSTPRRRVPAWSVGIGGSQTGVYPFETPGGWHLIGRTDTTFFDPIHSPPALLQPGDRVRFYETNHVNPVPNHATIAEPRGPTPNYITILDP